MPQTPILALPYPAATDPADVPTDMGELANRVEAVRGITNGLASLDATGKVPIAQLPSLAPSYGTTLPASPLDGQEAILVDLLTNPSYQWRFRYNAGSSSPYKWEFVGGSPLRAIGGNSGGVTTAIDLAGGPVLTAPRAGDYLLEFGIYCENSGVFGGAAFLDTIPTWSVLGAADMIRFAFTGQYGGSRLTHSSRRNAVSASETVKLRVQSSLAGSPGNFADGVLALIPLRLA